MRCDQFPGLPKPALEFLQQCEQICPLCHQSLPNKQVVGHYVGMFDNKYPLVRYQLNGGHHADEFLQADPWSSGPMFFLGLKISDGETFVWTQEEIDNGIR